MGWFIHHVNVQAHDVRQSAAFYRDIIGLKDGAWVYPETVGEVGHNPDSIAAFGSLNRGIHVVRAIPTFPRDNNLLHNPTIGGHFAFNVPDILAVKARLEAAERRISNMQAKEAAQHDEHARQAREREERLRAAAERGNEAAASSSAAAAASSAASGVGGA